MSYTHLTTEERYHIFAERKAGVSIRTIAAQLGRHYSTLYREINRNTGKRGYRPKQAHSKAQERKRRGNTQISDFAWAYIKHLVTTQQWSPEQIHGRLKHLGWHDVVSVERIYQWIYEDKRNGGDIHIHLRCQKTRRKRYKSGQQRRGQIAQRRDIDERPVCIDNRERIGDFEGDTIVGHKHKGILLTYNDRKSRFCIIRGHQNRLSQVIADSSIAALKSHQVHSITYDNGKEFAQHIRISDSLRADIYFAKPYASWQRGSNENMNGLIRQYFPKAMRLDQLTHQEIAAVENKLNNRPRKTLGYLTPLEVLSRYHTVALAS